MRLFFAIDAKPVKTELVRLQNELRRCDPYARLTPSDSFHITLRFIGQSDRLGELALALGQAVRGIRPFRLELGSFGCFERGRGKLAFAGVTGELSELRALHQGLEAALFDAGFAREGRLLTPHITIARDASLSEEEIVRLKAVKTGAGFTAGGVILYRSTRENNRMVYTPVHTEALL